MVYCISLLLSFYYIIIIKYLPEIEFVKIIATSNPHHPKKVLYDHIVYGNILYLFPKNIADSHIV